MDTNQLGTNIAALRRKRKMTQEQLADQSGLTVNYLSKIERGLAQNFSAINLLKIARALNTSVDDLAAGTQPRKHPVGSHPNRDELLFLLDQMSFQDSEDMAKLLVKMLKIMKRQKK